MFCEQFTIYNLSVYCLSRYKTEKQGIGGVEGGNGVHIGSFVRLKVQEIYYVYMLCCNKFQSQISVSDLFFLYPCGVVRDW